MNIRLYVLLVVVHSELLLLMLSVGILIGLSLSEFLLLSPQMLVDGSLPISIALLACPHSLLSLDLSSCP